jgi:cell division protein FtsL
MVRQHDPSLLIVVICALGVVTSQHKARKLFQALEAEQERAQATGCRVRPVAA